MISSQLRWRSIPSEPIAVHTRMSGNRGELNAAHRLIRVSGLTSPWSSVRIPMKGATDSNPKPATFSGRKPTTHPHGYRQGQMYAHIVAAWVGASG